ncbi:MAG: phage terminase family protein [Clostridiales Family XIII bacterium]|jgi:hypothetical protein|nr:phage terminase family protein [Clostridiales Family XIII bacterium]
MKRKTGNQSPTFCLIPEYICTSGKAAGKMATGYGLSPDVWQQNVLDVWLGRNENDEYAASRCGLLVPRQNGKNAILEMRELYGIAVLGEKFLHTAHQVKTSRKAFLRLAGFFENKRKYPELSELVENVRYTNGQEAIFLINGGSVEFVARSRGSARGFTVDIVVCDEAQEFTDEQLEALMPTMAAAALGNPQIILTGTPPNHNIPADVFKRIRAEAYKGDDKTLSWHEWSVEDVGDVSDVRRWYETNPALGIRLAEDFVRNEELNTMSEDGFARERLCWWSEGCINTAIDDEEWDALKTDEPPTGGKLAYGVKFAPDGSAVALAAALKNGGTVHVEVAEHRSLAQGTSWLVEWLLERWRKSCVIVIDGLNGASALSEALLDGGAAKKAVMLPRSGDVITSSTMLINAIKERKLSHFGQPALDMCAKNAVRRDIGNRGGWGFGGSGEIDVSPLEAVALAHYGVLTSKRNPERKQRLIR